MAAVNEGSVIFYDKNQSNSVLTALFDQKRRSVFCDVILKVCDKEIPAHSNVLAAASAYFTNVLQNDTPRGFSPKNPQIIEIQIQENDDSTSQYYEVVSVLIDFMYSGEMSVNLDWKDKLKEMATIMGLSNIVEFCEKISEENSENKRPLSNSSTPVKKVYKNKKVALDLSDESEDNFSDYCESSEEEKPLVVAVSKRGRPLKKKVFRDLGSKGAMRRKLKTPLKCNVNDDGKNSESPSAGEDANKSSDMKHMCEQCGYSTSRISHFKRHKLTHFPDEMKDSLRAEKKRKFCEICGFATHDSYHLRRHQLTHKSTGKYKCEKCSVTTRKVRELANHTREHQHEQNICSFCNIPFESQEELQEHLKKHSGEFPFLCPICNSKFKTRNQFKLHYPKHTDEKPFVCNICNAGFKWKHALKNHMIVHSNTKNHLCDTCGYATAHKSQLKAHKLIHTGDTFKCPHPDCKFQATKRQNLKYHQLTHTREKPHQCELCGQSFSLVKNMRRHMMLHSNSRPHTCEHCSFTSHRFDKLREHLLKQHNVGTPPAKRLTVQQAVLAAKNPPEEIVSQPLHIQTHPPQMSQGVENTMSHGIVQPPVGAVNQVLQFENNQPIIIQHTGSGQTYTVLHGQPPAQQSQPVLMQTQPYHGVQYTQ